MEIDRSSLATPTSRVLPGATRDRAVGDQRSDRVTIAPQPSHDASQDDGVPDDGGGIVGLTEALYRLRTNWSPLSHAGKNAIVSLPRLDVIAAYHRNDPPLAELVQQGKLTPTNVDTVV
jgi:hypothetical protein